MGDASPALLLRWCVGYADPLGWFVIYLATVALVNQRDNEPSEVVSAHHNAITQIATSTSLLASLAAN